MALANYGDLKTAVASYLNRSDLTSFIPDFITLAVSRINYGGEDPYPSQPVRVPAMEDRTTGAISSSSIAFPTGFLEPIRVAASSGGVGWSLTYMPPERFSEAANSSGLPRSYTYLQNAIKTAGTGAASYTLDFYKAFTAFSADGDTNWLLTNAPGVYLYASLLESAPFLAADERIAGWFTMLKAAIAAVNRSANRKASGSLQTRVVM